MLRERSLVIVLCFTVLLVYTLYDLDSRPVKETFDTTIHGIEFNALDNQYKELHKNETLIRSQLTDVKDRINNEMHLLELDLEKAECELKPQYLTPNMNQMYSEKGILTVPKSAKAGRWDSVDNECVPRFPVDCPTDIDCITKYKGKLETGFSIDYKNRCTYPSCASYCFEETEEETEEESYDRRCIHAL
jgi:hypothetical protein